MDLHLVLIEALIPSWIIAVYLWLIANRLERIATALEAKLSNDDCGTKARALLAQLKEQS